MEIPKIVQELLDKKAEMSNTVDLDAYANGLLDMYQSLQLQQGVVSRQSEQLVCDYCGKDKVEGLDHCECYNGTTWVKKAN